MKLVCAFLTIAMVSVVISTDPDPMDPKLKTALPHELAAHLQECKRLHDVDDADIRSEYLKRGGAGKNMKPFHACIAKAMGLVRDLFFKIISVLKQLIFAAFTS